MTAPYTLIHGDALEELAKMPAGSVDAVVTDPPYAIGVKSAGTGKTSWSDIENAAYWFSAWMREARRVLRSDGVLWSFLNWRSVPVYAKASASLEWSIESMLVWDKDWIGPGGRVGLRPSYELVAMWAMPGFAIPNRGLRDLQRFPWSSQKPNGHPAEKPKALLLWVLASCGLRENALVLDPFAGSGTTLVAAKQLGFRSIGIELDEGWCEYSARRLEEDMPLFRRHTEAVTP